MEQLKLESIIELASVLERQTDFQEVLRLITQKASTLIRAEIALIMMINPRTRQTVKTIFMEETGSEDRKYHLVNTNVSGWVIDNNTSFLTENIKTDLRFRKNLFKDTRVKSILCAPLRAEGAITGTLLLLSKAEGKIFNKTDLACLKKFAAIVAPFLHNVHKIQEYFNVSLPEVTLLKKYRQPGLLGKSKKFIELLQSIEAATRCDVRVLLEGQSGTGKELIAKAIHQYSPRGQNKFIAIDCGAIPANLIESELFGHIRGSFTGANFTRKGLFEEADGGTLFMDEINNLPLEMQAKLLRVLQENEIRPIGSNETRKVDVRIITASSSSLKNLVEQQKFREDLFYRLYVYPISVPSLNERHEDIPLLADFFLKKYSLEQQKHVEMFHEEIIDFLLQHTWAGNVRELENFVERLVTLTPLNSNIIDLKVLPNEFKTEVKKMRSKLFGGKYNTSLTESLEKYEEEIIRKTLMGNNWNQSKSARALKISEQTIRYKIKKFNIKK